MLDFVYLRQFKTQVYFIFYHLRINAIGDFLGGPVAKTLLLIQRSWVQFLARGLDPTCLNLKIPHVTAKTQCNQTNIF